MIPIDSRPVTYMFPQQVGAIAGVDAIAPPLEIMGSLESPADCRALSMWLDKALKTFAPDVIVVCLDSLLYGGLVASRCSLDSLNEIMERTTKIAEWKKQAGSKCKILVQSSIMRIPHYNTSKTEPAYWQEFGERIFRWSVLNHQLQIGSLDSDLELKQLEDAIPHTVIQEFLTRRERNFCVNQSLILLAASGSIDYLVFSQDDTAQFGLNVLEKTRLVAQAKAIGAENIVAYAGTDETIVALLSRWLIDVSAVAPVVSTQFIPRQGKDVISKFEGQTIGKSFGAIVDVFNLKTEIREARDNDDFAVVLHTGGELQKDHLAKSDGLFDTAAVAAETIKHIDGMPSGVVLCDVAYCNGADPCLINALLERPALFEKLWGYAGWNTTNNTIGSALAMAVAVWYARQNNFDYHEALKRALFVRFIDDWAYQSIVRPRLGGVAAEESLQKLMVPSLDIMAKIFAVSAETVILTLPWKRTFEVEVGLPSSNKGANIVA